MNTLSGKIAIIGADGMLGRAWQYLLKAQGLEFFGLDLPVIDVTSEASVARALGREFGTVINCAAYTDVDGSESHEVQATRLNGYAVGSLAAYCREIGAMLVHYSTDYVFDGQSTSPYDPSHTLEPVCAYGRSKAEGERQLIQSGCPHLLIRTSWLYAPWGNNFVRTMVRLMQERSSIRVVTDQVGRPSSAEKLAAASLALLHKGESGLFHITDGGSCSWYDFAVEIKSQWSCECTIDPCTTGDHPFLATRPAYSVLDITRTEQLLGPMNHWSENLADVLTRLGAEPA